MLVENFTYTTEKGSNKLCIAMHRLEILIIVQLVEARNTDLDKDTLSRITRALLLWQIRYLCIQAIVLFSGVERRIWRDEWRNKRR